jgi:hypothetical protein
MTDYVKVTASRLEVNNLDCVDLSNAAAAFCGAENGLVMFV